MNTEEINIKAYDLAIEMTALNIKCKDLKGRKPIKKEHIDNNRAVIKMLAERGISISSLCRVARRFKFTHKNQRVIASGKILRHYEGK